MRDRARRLVPPALVALLGGVAVLAVAVGVFPHHSVNDDEAVYLTQAAMLAEGQVYLRPGPLAGLVRPWFFVAAERAGEAVLYSKYTPPTAALFAPFVALGVPRAALALVGAGVAAAGYGLAARAFDRRTGVVAGVLVVASPLYLFTTGTFLSYAPAALLNGAFALAYLRATARDSLRWGALAGALVGLSFWTRPYTAVLFALPFVGHALVRLWRAETRRARGVPLAVAALGLCGVGAALAYNAAVVGSPLTFPYQAFAPRDGVGFGPRRLLDYGVDYTPALAARTTLANLGLLVDSLAGGPLGVGVALAGAALALGRREGETLVVGLLAALVPCVVLGEAYFWGTLNGLRNGLFELLGPYYHYGLLYPFAAFGAHATVRAATRARAVYAAPASLRPSADPRRVRVALLVSLLVAAPVAGAAEYRAVEEPYDANRERTADLAAAYEPFESRDLSDALVFHPTPYGDWSAHPFQRLRNDPGFDGDVVYAFDGGPAADWRAVDATTRLPYRYTYRGTWTPGEGDSVVPQLVALDVRTAPLTATTTVGAPDRATGPASVRVATPSGVARYRVPVDGGAVTVRWRVGDRVRVLGHEVRGGAPPRVPPGASEADLAVTFATASGATVTYRQEVTVSREGSRTRALWPPETRVCRLTPDCGRESTWVGPEGDYLDGVRVSTSATAP